MPPSVFPTGVTIYLPDKAHNNYVIFDTKDGFTRLIDMNGNQVKFWSDRGMPGEMIDPALTKGDRGHVFVGERVPDIQVSDVIRELDWNGNIIWEWGKKAPGGKAKHHHDQARLANGNTLVLADIKRIVPQISDQEVPDSVIYEVTLEGEITWQWVVSEHLEEFDFSTHKLNQLKEDVKGFGLASILGLNDMAPLGPNKWFEQGEGRFHPDNMMISCRTGSYVAIVDKKTGKICWRLGPDHPGAHDLSKKEFAGGYPRPVGSTSGQHDAHMIGEGLPGSGNVLIFDNQGPAGYPPNYLEMFEGSRVIEIDPTTKQIVWQYDASCSGRTYWEFSSRHVSSARRLPNGNTLICEGEFGRFFQVTPKGEIVWEYVSPFYDKRPAAECSPGRAGSNQTYRAQPVPYDWVPEGTPRSENPVIPQRREAFHV